MKKETIIEISFDEKDDYISQFNNIKLSNKLSNYILEECRGKSLSNCITLNVKTNFKINANEKEEFIKMVHENYKTDLQEHTLILRHSNLKKLIIFFIGILLIYMAYFRGISENEVISEVILIIGWVAIWEAAYTWFFETDKNRIKAKRLKQLAKCRINFI